MNVNKWKNLMMMTHKHNINKKLLNRNMKLFWCRIKYTGNLWWLELGLLKVLDHSKWVSGPNFFPYINTWFLKLLISRNPWSLEVKLQSSYSQSIFFLLLIPPSGCVYASVTLLTSILGHLNSPTCWMFIQVTLVVQGANWSMIDYTIT